MYRNLPLIHEKTLTSIMIEQILCVSLELYKARRNLMLRQFEHLKKHVPCEIVDATVYDSVRVNQCMNGLASPRLRSGQVGCSLSHYDCLKQIVEKRLDVACIVEDDLVFVPDFLEKVTSYFQNTPSLLESMKDTPYYIYGAGFWSARKENRGRTDECFVPSAGQCSTCCYILNHHTAKLLLDQMFPMIYATDVYYRYMLNDKSNNINVYSALPMLCYDLSTEHFKYMWTKEDRRLRRYINRLSGKVAIHRKIRHEVVYQNQSDYMCKHMVRRFTHHHTSFQTNSSRRTHFLFVDSVMDHCTTESIVCGTGIQYVNQNICIPKLVCYVRGRYTRNRMLELGIECPERYGDPYLLLSNLYHPSDVKVVKHRIGIIIAGTTTVSGHVSDSDSTITTTTHEYLVLSYDTMTREQLVEGILSCNSILSECLKGVILAHAYGKKALWYYHSPSKPFSSSVYDEGPHTSMMIPQFIEFLDYYSGVLLETDPACIAPCLKDPLTITNRDVEAYPNPSTKRVEEVKKKMWDYTPFMISNK